MKPTKTWCFTKLYFILSCLFLCLILQTSCTPPTASKQKSEGFYKYKVYEANFDLGYEEKFEYFNLHFESDGSNRLLVSFEKKNRSNGENIGRFLKFSKDGGETFGEEYKVSKILKDFEKFDGFGFYLVPGGFAAIAYSSNNIFYSHSPKTLQNWNEFTQINDEQGSFAHQPKILQVSETEIYCVWIDKRRNFALTFFSSSFDGGKSWSANQPIDFDFREGDQNFLQIVQGSNERLHVFWHDNRDRKTLYDIRHSYSDDKGKNWVPSQKVNDDNEEVWQIVPTVAVAGSNIYAGFSDFREPGEENDRDWNIYFTRSKDNGTTWEKNKRLNDVKEGRDGIPVLNVDDKGNLFAVWLTTRNTIFGQFAFSYSKDQGNTWSPSIILTKPDELLWHDWFKFQTISDGRFLFVWSKKEGTKRKSVYSIIEQTSDFIDSREQSLNLTEQDPVTIKYRLGKILFSDDFSSDTANKWVTEFGVWDVVDGTFRGVRPNKGESFISFAKFKEPESFVMRGQFKFDSVSHNIASIYFRRDEKSLKHYVLSNRFRYGAWLSVKEDDQPIGEHTSGGRPLVQKRFSFRQDRWYKFTLVVTPEQVDYYVEDRLMLSLKEKLIYPSGKIGIGGYLPSPTYFDNIVISEITE